LLTDHLPQQVKLDSTPLRRPNSVRLCTAKSCMHCLTSSNSGIT